MLSEGADLKTSKTTGKEYLNRIAEIRKVLIITMLLNFLVSGVKIFYGYYTNSLAILSDGFHSLFDGVSNIVGLLGLYLSSRPPDEKHPYGHGKHETLFTIFVGLLMLATCVEIFKKIYDSITNTHAVEVTYASFIIMTSTMIINSFVAKYEAKKGRNLNSEYLLADSQHTRSDVYISVGVIISLALMKFNLLFADVITGAIVGVFVARAGINIIKEAADSLIDRTKIDKSSIKQIVHQVKGVRGCHGVRTRGTISHVFVDLHLVVEPSLSVQDAHEIAHIVEEEIKRRFPEVVDIIVHVEPHP